MREGEKASRGREGVRKGEGEGEAAEVREKSTCRENCEKERERQLRKK